MSTSTTNWEALTKSQERELDALEASAVQGGQDAPRIYKFSELRDSLELGKTVVKISIPTNFRAFTCGESAVEVLAEPPTLGVALIALCEKYPDLAPKILDEDSTPLRHINVFLGNENARSLQNTATPVRTGEQISILAAVAGG